MTKYLSVTLILVGGACLTAFYFSASYIDPDGFLHEPFALLGTGYILLIAGIVGGLVAWRRKAGNPEPPI
jgi:hypothetical protein